jgi:CheY-like chemotaxis protein
LETREKPLILVVDDQATIIRIMTSILQPKYDVCVATNGKKALDVARTRQPDLILLDNMMPEMTGIEICMALKEIPATANIPVIFVTSMDDKHNEQMGFKVGAVDYMNKPPSREIVHARISVHLKNQRQRQFLDNLARGVVTDIQTIASTARKLLTE